MILIFAHDHVGNDARYEIEWQKVFYECYRLRGDGMNVAVGLYGLRVLFDFFDDVFETLSAGFLDYDEYFEEVLRRIADVSGGFCVER